jgi:hypothetical protein
MSPSNTLSKSCTAGCPTYESGRARFDHHAPDEVAGMLAVGTVADGASDCDRTIGIDVIRADEMNRINLASQRRSARFCCPLLESGGLTSSLSTNGAKFSPRVIEQPIIEYVPSTTADLLCIYYLASRCETLCLARILTVI